MLNDIVAGASGGDKLHKDLIDIAQQSLRVSVWVELGVLLSDFDLVEEFICVVPAPLDLKMHNIAWDTKSQTPGKLLKVAPEVERGHGRPLLKLALKLN